MKTPLCRRTCSGLSCLTWIHTITPQAMDLFTKTSFKGPKEHTVQQSVKYINQCSSFLHCLISYLLILLSKQRPMGVNHISLTHKVYLVLGTEPRTLRVQVNHVNHWVTWSLCVPGGIHPLWGFRKTRNQQLGAQINYLVLYNCISPSWHTL